jgi:hypothetical protein
VNKNVFFIIFSFIISNSFAQKLEIGGGVGLTHYKGDLNQRVNPFLTRPATDIFVRYNLNRAVSLSANVFFGAIVGDDRKSNNPFNRSREFNFVNVIDNYNLQIEYNFLNFRTISGIVKSSWTPYLFGGIGGFQTLIKTYYIGTVNSSVSDSKWFKESSTLAIPFGVGFKKALSSKVNLGGSITINKILGKKYGDTFDGLGISKQKNKPLGSINYYDVAIGSPNFIANNYLKDTFYYTRFYISYVFYRTYCPPSKKLKLKKF